MAAPCNYVKKEYPETVAAYMAGILDGEGCLTIGDHSGNRKNGDKHFQVIIAVSSTDKVLVDWLYDTFGGYRGEYSRNQTPKSSLRKVYRWQCSGDRLLHICQITLPYLVIKKRQAEILIEMRGTYVNAHNQKGFRNTQRVPAEILLRRQQLLLEIRQLHNRNYTPKNDV